MAPSIPAALERVASKAMNKVPEERYETARQMQSALFSIRAALSGASETTARLGPRWTPFPAVALRLITHAPIKWRAAVLTALMVTALVLLYVSRPFSPSAAPSSGGDVSGATLDWLVTYPLPSGLNPALAAQRDSTLAARQRARGAGAMKNNVPTLILAETMLLTSEPALRSRDPARAAGAATGRATPRHRRAAAGPGAGRLERAGGQLADVDAGDGGQGRRGVAELLPALHPADGALHDRAVRRAGQRSARDGAHRLHLRPGGRRRPGRDPFAPGDQLHQDPERLAHREHPGAALKGAGLSPRRARSPVAVAGCRPSRPGPWPAPRGAVSPASRGRPPSARACRPPHSYPKP